MSFINKIHLFLGKACFDTCPLPLNLISDCYLDCYKNTLLGDAAYNITAMTQKELVAPWEAGFAGACAPVTPGLCHGPQCP